MTKPSGLRGLCRELVQLSATFNDAAPQVRTGWETLDFFASHETSYSLTLAYPDDILLESARKMGIAVEGRQKTDIVQDMLRASGMTTGSARREPT